MSVLKEKTITKGVFIKAGQAPKICMSIADAGMDAVLEEASLALESPADMIEWRADAYESAADLRALAGALKLLRGAAADMPVMFTYRTSEEGGQGSDDPKLYASIVKTASDSGCVDMVDIQTCGKPSVSRQLVDYAHAKGQAVIASYHDFEETPSVSGICECFESLKSSGADIVKIAVMADRDDDVRRLLEAATETRRKHPEWPLVAIAMGEAGMPSRIDAEEFGSCIIYAAGSKQTAPGQIDVYELVKMRSARGRR